MILFSSYHLDYILSWNKINGDILCRACMELASHMDNAGSGPCPRLDEMCMQSVVQDETICKR